MMKIFNRKNLKRLIGFFILTAFMVACVFLDSVEGPETALINETVNFKMNVRIEPAENVSDQRLVVAFLAPSSWNPAENTTITYTSSIDEGVQTASLVPEDAVPRNAGGTWQGALRDRFGVGPNVLNDMEWVVFWTDKNYNLSNGEKVTVTFDVETTVGPENVKAKLGFFINNTGDGLSNDTARWKVLYTDCFEVTGGDGPITDFCELRFNFAQPLTATKNDILTIKYQGDIGENPLTSATEIHFCGTAYTFNGNAYEVCDRNEKTRMSKESVFGNTYALSLWPGDFFNIPEGEELERIEYSFLNQDGSVELMDDEETPFVYFFKCE